MRIVSDNGMIGIIWALAGWTGATYGFGGFMPKPIYFDAGTAFAPGAAVWM
jgi:hypothetical protein